MDRQTAIDHINNQYGVEPDFPWEGDLVPGAFISHEQETLDNRFAGWDGRR